MSGRVPVAVPVAVPVQVAVRVAARVVLLLAVAAPTDNGFSVTSATEPPPPLLDAGRTMRMARARMAAAAATPAAATAAPPTLALLQEGSCARIMETAAARVGRG